MSSRRRRKPPATADGRPIYNFALYVKPPPATLDTIHSVHYRFEHDTFRQKEQAATQRKDRFMARYTGWGCLSKVDIVVKLNDGTEQKFDFDMCQSLGPQWE